MTTIPTQVWSEMGRMPNILLNSLHAESWWSNHSIDRTFFIKHLTSNFMTRTAISILHHHFHCLHYHISNHRRNYHEVNVSFTRNNCMHIWIHVTLSYIKVLLGYGLWCPALFFLIERFRECCEQNLQREVQWLFVQGRS